MQDISEDFLSVKDFSVSKETFLVKKIPDIAMFATVPQPSATEIYKYYQSENYISHTDANRTFFDKIYQSVKRFAIKQKVKLLQAQLFGKGNLLDYGAGTGDFLYSAKLSGWKSVGFEASEQAKHLGRTKGVCYAESTSSIDDHFFNAITLWHVLEHLHDLDRHILEFKRLLALDGVLIIAVPNFKSYDAAYYREYWAAYDVPRHLWHFSKDAIHTIFEKHQMKVVKTLPMFFDAFYVSILSEKHKGSRFAFLKGFWIGLVSNFRAIRTKEFSSQIYVIRNR